MPMTGAGSSCGSMAIIEVGCHIVIRKKSTYRCCHLQAKRQEGNVEKLKFSFEKAIGHPFGSSFEVKDRQLHRCDHVKEVELEKSTDAGTLIQNESDLSMDKDNREIVDSRGASQQMSMSEIVEMKDQGLRGASLVNKLVESSSTFSAKTVFSQHKYVKRKMKKHGDIVTLMRPSLRLLATIQYSKDPERVGNLHPASLSLLLGYGNVHSGMRIIVLDNCLGLVSASVLERLDGRGSCLHLHKGPRPQAIPILQNLDLSEGAMEAFSPLPISCVFDGLEDLAQSGALIDSSGERFRPRHGKKVKSAKPQRPDNTKTKKLNGSTAASGGIDGDTRDTKVNSEECDFVMTNRQAEALNDFIAGSFDCLIIANSPYHNVNIVKALLPKLMPSRPFVVYSMYTEPLIECFKYIKGEHLAVNVTIAEVSSRDYQVLPDRTHPEMSQGVGNGYLLWGVTVALD